MAEEKDMGQPDRVGNDDDDDEYGVNFLSKEAEKSRTAALMVRKQFDLKVSTRTPPGAVWVSDSNEGKLPEKAQDDEKESALSSPAIREPSTPTSSGLPKGRQKLRVRAADLENRPPARLVPGSFHMAPAEPEEDDQLSRPRTRALSKRKAAQVCAISPSKRTLKTKRALKRMERLERRKKQLDEEMRKKNEGVNTSSSSSNDEDDCSEDDVDSDFDEEFEIKVMWNYEVQKFKVRKEELLSKLVYNISCFWGLDDDDVCLNHIEDDDFESQLCRDRTVAENGISRNSFLKAKKLAQFPNTSEREVTKNKKKPNEVELRMRTSKEDRRNDHVARVDRSQPLSFAMDEYAKVMEVTRAQLRFVVDGETIAADATAEELELGDNDCIDVYFVKNSSA